MTTSTPPPRRILAVMDNGDTQVALRSAAVLADRHSASLEAFACVEPPHDLDVIGRLARRGPDQLIDEVLEKTRQKAAERLAATLPGRQVDLRVAMGKTFVEVIRHVVASACDFVVKTVDPPSQADRFQFASTDQHLLRKCPCPVWLQTAQASSVPQRVLAAVDVDSWDAAEPETLFALNRQVIDTARHVAAGSDAEVIVLHAWEAVAEGMIWAFSSDADPRASADAYVNEVFDARHEAMRRLLARSEEDSTRGCGAPLFPRLVRGAPESVIEAQSRELDADVVVMGTVARTGLSGLFIGNTAENIINSLQRSVIAVKPEGFVSPLGKDRESSGTSH